jgi:iron-sulfur cluster assembly protein
MIEITEDAANKLKEYIYEGLPEKGSSLRIKVVGGGCSGLRYELAFDVDGHEDFIEEAANGIKVIIDEKSALYMVGTQLDFVDSLMESGFKINNPNATNSCGCGESFGM